MRRVVARGGNPLLILAGAIWAYGHSVETRVHIDCVARDTACEIREQERCGVTHFINRHGAVQGRGLFHVVKDLGEVLDAGSSQGLNGARGDGVGADSLRPQRPR